MTHFMMFVGQLSTKIMALYVDNLAENHSPITGLIAEQAKMDLEGLGTFLRGLPTRMEGLGEKAARNYKTASASL